MGEETTIMGTVLSVVFQNEENGYAVLRLVTDDGELLTLVGCVPCAAPGENLTATGSFSSHPQYGEQFSASEVERYLPSNETEILNYLASGVVRGVGPPRRKSSSRALAKRRCRCLNPSRKSSRPSRA